MTVSLSLMKSHINVTGSTDDVLIDHYVDAAEAMITAQLGEGADTIPVVTMDQAVMMLAAHWYENREAVVVGLSTAFLPMGVAEIIREFRSYSFGQPDE